MAKQLNVSLAFNANTSQAKAQIQDLQRTLDTLVKGSAAGAAQNGLPLTKDLMEAQIAATKLGTILSQSLNTQTGNLDLTKFSDSLNKSGMKLEVLKGQLESLGPTGQKAFMSLASSIVSADVPLTRTNKLVSELWTTMKNTARWQLSSSMLHSFMGTIQSAVGYAQDLNESLNNIRIVTGQSTEQMAAFAERANKAAKSLSTTTTEYTNASLIYYQQGLSDQEVQDRADITIKMAHASGQSAEIVSDQMTAVWNNFYDGSKSLEHYADVMTALGAATASSSDEIAGGLEKFASIADMIGLSYEYAASALATITAQTRQSEEVVGTALKTIFARIQGLNLGETLDDGTTMNKYSEALNKVGISIKDQNGELKDMDAILNEMGAKWETLSKDQQTALAQTVAGVRQYNQLVSLMDNWDFFEQNLAVAQGSDGALQKQADIYAESWEAARDRVTAAAQNIYDSILDDDFFITILNGFEKLLTGVGEFTDSLNGLPGILSVLGVIVTKVFNSQLAASVERIAFNIRSLTGQTQAAAEKLRNTAMQEASTISFNTGTAAGDLQGEQLKRRLELQNQIREVSKNMSADQKEQLASLLQINDAYAQQAILAAEAQDKASDKAQESRGDIRSTMRKNGASETAITKDLNSATGSMQNINRIGLNAADAIKKIEASFNTAAKSTHGFTKQINDIVKGLNTVGRTTAARKVEELRDKFNSGKITGAQFKAELQKIVNVQDMLDDTALIAAQKLDILKQKFNLTDAQCEEYANDLLRLAEATRTADNANDAYTESYNNLKTSINGFQGAMNNFGTSVVKGVQGISQMAMGINALVAAWDTLNNEDMSFGEKLLSVTMSLTMAIPALIGGYQALKEAKLGEAFASMKTAAAEMVDAASKAVAAGAAGTATVASGSLTFSLLAQAAAWVALQLSISPLLALLLVVVGAIAAVALVAWGLVKVFQAIKAASPEGQLKALQEQADKSAEAFNKVQESVNATKEAIDSLKESYEVIEGLKQGTEEWNEAISNTNAQVLNLLENYPDIEKFIYSEDGVLKLYQEGYDTIENTDAARLAAANNLKISDQVAVAEQELNNSYYNFKTGSGSVLPSSYAQVLQSAYEDLGEQLFTQESSDEILRVLQESNAALGYTNESFYEAVKANEELIKSNSAKQNYINTLEDYQLESTVSSTGTTRSADEIRALMGEESSYDAMRSEKRAEVVSSFDNDWNDYIDYNKSNAKQWSMIEDFMSTKGEDVEYVAQKGGKMVIKVDGDEQEYSAKEFYDTLAELYTAPEFITSFEDKLKESLRDTLGNAVDSLSADDIVEIDNFKQGLIDSFTDLGASEDYSNKTFNAMADLYKNEEDPSAGIEDFVENISYVDTSSEEFINLANAIAAVNSEAEKLNLKTQLEDLNAQGQIETMGDYFSQEAEAMGLDKSAGAEMHDYARQLMEVDEQSEMLDDNLSSNAEAAAEVATSVTRMNKGIDTLADNFTDWNDILKKSDKSSAEYSKAINGMRDALGDVLDVESDIIDNDFIEGHLEEIEKAATGDADAIDALKAALAEDVLLEVVGVSKFDELNTDIQNLHNQILNMDDEIKVGAVLEGGSDFANEAQKLIDTSKMSVEEAQAYFNSLGYEPEFVTEEQTATRNVPIERTHTDYELTTTNVTADLGPFGSHTLSLPGFDRLTTTSIDGYTPVEEKIQVPALSSDGTPTIKKLTKKSSGAMNNYSGSNTGGKKPGSSGSNGGNGSKPKKATLTKKSDIVDRYKQVEDQLDDISDAADDASKAMDRLYGKSRVDKMREVNKLLLDEVDLLEQKKNEAAGYLDEDRKALQDSVSGFDMSFTFDDKGNISNYQTIMNDLYKQLSDMETDYGDEWDESEQENIDNLKEKIDKVKEAISQYDDTRELMEDIDNEIQEKIYEWQDNNYEILQYELELKLEINDDELRILEFKLKRMEDNFYKMAESAAILGNNQVKNYQNQLQVYEGHKASLDAAYAAGEISEDAYMEGIKEVRDGIYEQLEALLDLDDQMMHYYRDTLEAASEEVADFTDHMEHLTGVFDHYLSLMEILGKQKDYDAMGNFLGGKADTIKDRLDVAKEYYNMLKENSKADEYWANYQNALAAKDTDMAAWWKEQWDAETEALDEAQDNMLSLTEEWAEAMKAVIENNMNQISDTLEKALTGGLGFDKLMDDFDKLNTRQEEYLTKTNQLYETNKLMRTANKALDETDNQAAKLKLKNFIDETKSLQENTQLSKYELEIQQAKYDLLLAEIALEEAQNAKATVRLSRDNEGNFGYVYTADQDAISDAQQELDDAENRLYNKSLEGQQNYTEKYLQAQQEMFNQLDELWQLYHEEGAITQEEYEKRYADLQNHYYGEGGVLSTYAHLYNIGVQTDANATADNWQKNYGAMTQNTAAWQSAVDTYYTAIQEQIASWESVATTANSNVSGALNNSATATKNLTDESEVLRDKIVNGIIPAIDDELIAVQNQTDAYADQRDTLLQLIDAYGQYINQLNSQVAAANTDFDKNTDYTALMNEYLNSGGKIGDATYNELLRQRDAKIEWLKTQGKDASYWGTSGEETTKMYEALVNGDEYKNEATGEIMTQEWFKDNYLSDEKLKEVLVALEIPLGALEKSATEIKGVTDEIKASTDTVGEKVDASKENTTTTGEGINTKIGELGDGINTKTGEVGDGVKDTINDSKDNVIDQLDTNNQDAASAFSSLEGVIETESANISGSIDSAAGEIVGAISGLKSEISGLRSTVTGAALGSIAGPVGTVVGGIIGTVVSKFDSGGYTGDWGPQAKLAMLHEKELVLNATDTENLLSTIGLVREISNMIDIQASGASLFNLMATNGLTTANEVLEQNVTIHAEFPNATNHSEIEEAFNNLVNKASQYANRK